jgi:16S rRNA (guanine966-N2)-methyltransferase
VTRIIGGFARGRRIETPPGRATRPTTDRTREALFSSLESELGSLQGLDVLDLYAGSGAIGLEAVSRGARHATFVEADRRVSALIRRNAAALGMGDVAVVTGRAESVVSAPPRREPFDVAYVDPPYDLPTPVIVTVLERLTGSGWLAEDAVVVVERAVGAGEPRWPAGYHLLRRRRYGETILWYVALARAPTTERQE